MDNSSQGKFQITKGKPTLRLQEIIMDSDGLLTLVKLNLLFIITTIPFLPVVMLFTGGASITALLYCTNQLVRTGTVSEVKNTYFNVFKTYFRKTFTAGLVVVLLNILFIGGLMFYITMASSNIIYIPFAISFGIISDSVFNSPLTKNHIAGCIFIIVRIQSLHIIPKSIKGIIICKF